MFSKKVLYNLKLLLILISSILFLLWKSYAQQENTENTNQSETNHINNVVVTSKDIKDIKENKENKENEDKVENNQPTEKKNDRITQKDLINMVSTDENTKKIEEKDKELNKLKNEVTEIKNTHVNITAVEIKIKDEIKRLEQQIKEANASWKLKDEVEALQNELNLKKWVMAELVQERTKLELKEVELNKVKKELETVKEEYQKKIVEQKSKKLKYLFFTLIWLFGYILATRLFKKLVKISPDNDIKIKTIIGIVDSFIFTTIIIYIFVEFLSIYKQFVYVLMIALSWLLLAFKEYILSFFAFIFKILFTYKVGDTIEIEKKIAKIKSIWIIFTELELYTMELVPIWNRTFFNQTILLNWSAFNISELWYENEYDFFMKREDFHAWMANDDYNLLWLIEEICKLNTVSNNMAMEELSKKLFLFYHIKIKTDKDNVIIAINTKTLSNKSQEIYKFILSINQLIELTSSKNNKQKNKKIEIIN